MNKKILFRGAASALITPFDKNGEVNLSEFKRIIEDQIQKGIDALVVCGTTGEAPTLSDKEHQTIIDCAAGIIDKRVPLIAGTGSNDTAHAIMMSKQAAANGADGLLLVTPYYNRASSEGLIKSYTAIADSVNIPMLIYNVPGRTSVDISFDVYEKLSYHPNLVGIKEASSNIAKLSRLTCELSDYYSIYTGCDSELIPALALGASGVISVTSNILPSYIHDICQNWFKNNTSKALEMYRKISHLNDLLFSEINPIPVKAAMNMIGFEAGGVRLPLTEMTTNGKKKIYRELEKFGII